MAEQQQNCRQINRGGLANRIVDKYPQYGNMSAEDLVGRIVAKHPVYAGQLAPGQSQRLMSTQQLQQAAAPTQGFWNNLSQNLSGDIANVGKGILQGGATLGSALGGPVQAAMGAASNAPTTGTELRQPPGPG